MLKIYKKYLLFCLNFFSKKSVIFLTFLCVISGALSIIPIYIMQSIVDYAVYDNNKRLNNIILLGILYLVIQVIHSVVASASEYYAERIQKKEVKNLQVNIFKKLTDLDLVNNEALNIKNIIIEDSNCLADYSIKPIIESETCFVSFAMTLFYLINIDTTLTILLFPLLLITSLISNNYQQKIEDKIEEKRANSKKLWKNFNEFVSSIVVIRACHKEEYFKNKVEILSDDCKEVGISQSKLEIENEMLLSLLFMGSIGLILIITSIFVIQKKIKIGAMVSILMYNHMIVDPLLQIINLQSLMTKIVNSYNHLETVLTQKETKIEYDDSYIPRLIEVKVNEFYYANNNKKFSYNFIIKEKEKLALCGETGIGKSTIAKILCGLIKVNEDQVIFRDSESKERVRPLIAYQEQECYLFDDTILNNILLGNNNVNDIDSILSLCHLNELNDRYKDVTIGENGNKLSGGERKRIVIARTLAIENASLFIFDEICSSLDRETAQSIVQEICNRLKDKMVIFIDHNDLIKNYVDEVVEVK